MMKKMKNNWDQDWYEEEDDVFQLWEGLTEDEGM